MLARWSKPHGVPANTTTSKQEETVGLRNISLFTALFVLEPHQPPLPPSAARFHSAPLQSRRMTRDCFFSTPRPPRLDSQKRELRQNTKRLEKAESFASDLEAEVQRVAGDGVTFETFVVLKRDNNALKTQLAELRKASEGGRHSIAAGRAFQRCNCRRTGTMQGEATD